MIHDAAAQGYKLESETYANARPSYHPEVVDAVVDRLGMVQPAAGVVVDLGAGTGIATAMLIERDVDVLAVEPVAEMRASLTKRLPNVRVVEGTAESIPVDDASTTAVLVAQAFHWFNHPVALNEIARVLRPGGSLVTLWNVRDESVPWMAAYTAVQDRYQGDTPRYRNMVWRQSIEDHARFAFDIEITRDNPQASNPDQVVARFLSTSFIARLDRAEQTAVEQEIRSLVADLGDAFDFPYWTEAQIWRFT